MELYRGGFPRASYVVTTFEDKQYINNNYAV